MARKPRIHIPGALYHVMLRGNGGQPIFFSDRDRCRLCLLIQEGIERFDHKIHAFCFMGNHIHLAIQTGKIPLSQIVQNFAFRYAAYLNKQRKRVGHVFQGRFKSILVDEAAYLSELVRYIHLNPVRANLVESPGDYTWSGHRTYLGKSPITWLSTEQVLTVFGASPDVSRSQYREFIDAALHSKQEIEFEKGYESSILGDNDFIKEVLIDSLSKTQIQNPPSPIFTFNDLVDCFCTHFQITANTLINSRCGDHTEIRGILILVAQDELFLSSEFIGKAIKRNASGLRRLAQRTRKRASRSPSLSSKIETVRTEIRKKAPTAGPATE